MRRSKVPFSLRYCIFDPIYTVTFSVPPKRPPQPITKSRPLIRLNSNFMPANLSTIHPKPAPDLTHLTGPPEIWNSHKANRQDPRAYRSATGSQRCLPGRLIQAIVVLYSTNCRQPLPSRPSDRRLPTISGGPQPSGTSCIGIPSKMPPPAPVSPRAGSGVIAISPCALHRCMLTNGCF